MDFAILIEEMDKKEKNVIMIVQERRSGGVGTASDLLPACASASSAGNDGV